MTKTSGTKEWAESNINCYYGCSNNCTYCYAKRMAMRFERISNEEEWEVMKPNQKAIDKKYKKRKGTIMFPTSHDITPESVDGCIIVLKKLLKSGNNVIIVSKANYECIDKVYAEVLSKKNFSPNRYINQVEFRITVGSISNETLKKYEPNAPPFFYSRLATISGLSGLDFKTSVSMEPFFDKDPIDAIKFLFKNSFFNGTLWIGTMSGTVPKELKPNYTKENLLKIVENINKLSEKIRSRIRYKDSIRNKLNL